MLILWAAANADGSDQAYIVDERCRTGNSIFILGMQMVFEEYGFKSFLAMPAQPLSLLEWQAQQPSLPANTAGIGVVVDAGAHPLSSRCRACRGALSAQTWTYMVTTPIHKCVRVLCSAQGSYVRAASRCTRFLLTHVVLQYMVADTSR